MRITTLPWAIFLIGAGLAYFSGLSVKKLEKEKQLSTFEALVEQRLNALEKSLYSFQELQFSGQLYFQNSQTLDKETFQQFLASRTKKNDGIHAVFWTPKVDKNTAHQFVRDVVEQEDKDYAQFTLYPETPTRCGSALNKYTFPVLYVSPETHTKTYVGWRADSQCEFVFAMERAFFQRSPESHFFKDEHGGGLRLFSAIVDKNALRGFLTSTLYFEDFFGAIWPHEKIGKSLHITVTPQFSNKGSTSALYQTTSLENINASYPSVRHLVAIPGNEEGVWIEFQPLNYGEVESIYSLIVMILTMLLTVATAACIWSYSNRLQLASKLVKEQTKKLRFQARHDQLTTLHNRVALEKNLKEEKQKISQGVSDGFSLLFIDLDRFKNVNDSLGHLIGDRLLREVAKRLLNITQDNHRVFRFGGDEFVVCLSGITCKVTSLTFATRYLSAISDNYIIDEHNIQLGASIGISAITDPQFTLLDIIQQADIAMYHAKESGASISFYEERMLKQVQARFNIEQELSQAVELEQLYLMYQPILKSNRVEHFEALLRWNNPNIGQVSPADFIPIAEDTNHIHRIGNWVFVEVCKQLDNWYINAENDTFPGITVNVSAKQLQSPSFVDFVKTLLSRHSFPAQKLGIEITESTLIGNENVALEALNGLRALGIRLYLDDFGTGYSSLSLLSLYPFDVLKIDRSFITDVALPDSKSSRLCSAIINLSHAIDIDVVAEGVETQVQLDWLSEKGCDYVQGFLKSRPLPKEQLVYWHRACHEKPPIREI
ncbi:bifunctional diguanylate cyclase/phosphodiesterase [Enterovibrio norvegicus]|uniref:bifunctional diguanylate cyclase/phosphodiesterase n=1 Tax=Enterovibrio norvegicus TaxID=188144 RepID=UPI0013D37B29|nr:EAL domain-containing protein [Enterovibrio norvegicus]